MYEQLRSYISLANNEMRSLSTVVHALCSITDMVCVHTIQATERHTHIVIARTSILCEEGRIQSYKSYKTVYTVQTTMNICVHNTGG